MEAEPGPGTHAPLPQVANGHDVVVLGARESFLAAEGFHGSFLLRARVPCIVGCTAGPRVLERGRRLDAEAVEVLHGLRRPLQEADEAAKGAVQGSPQWR